jgi:hypothetical protein
MLERSNALFVQEALREYLIEIEVSGEDFAKRADVNIHNINTLEYKDDCSKLPFRSIKVALNSYSERELIFEINKRISDARFEILYFITILFSLPVLMLIFGLAVRYVYKGFKESS